MNAPNPAQSTAEQLATAPRSVVFRSGTVVPMDAGNDILSECDVLVVDDTIAAIGTGLSVPEGTVEIDASGGILMPGMIDTHRHMWQSAQRGFGADWSLTDYFHFYYINWGQIFRPEDVYAGNLLAALESIDAGVTTTVDWSHGLRTLDHADAAVDALEAVPGRFVLAYGNIAGAPWEWATSPDFRRFAERRFTGGNDLLSLQLAFDVIGGEDFPEKAAFDVAKDLDVMVTTHSGVWGAAGDDTIRRIDEHGYLTDKLVHVHAGSLSDDGYARIGHSGGHVSVSTESECSAGQGYSPTKKLREHGIPISLSVDSSAWWSADMLAAMRATLNADRALEHLRAHESGQAITNLSLRAADVVRYGTVGGAAAAGLDHLTGSIAVGKKADLVLLKNENSPTMFPILNPFGHIVFQAGRADIHTVVVNGRVLKYDHRLLLDEQLTRAKKLVAASVEHVRAEIGGDALEQAMHPELPDTQTYATPHGYMN